MDEEQSSELNQHTVSLGGGSIGTLYTRQTPLTPPSWLNLFAGSLEDTPRLRNASVSAVYLTRAGGRLFALVFGHGRHLLRQGSFEERFGLRVTLNSVDPRYLRGVDVTTLETNPFHAKRQASRAAPLGDFGLNLDQDILKAVTGPPTDARLGSQMTGIDSLSVRLKIDLPSIKSLLRRYLEKSEEQTYRQLFPWVDHVSEVRDATLAQSLFQRLTQVIEKKAAGSVWAAIPEVIDWTTFDSFRFGSQNAPVGYDDVTLERIIDSLAGEQASLELLRRKRVLCIVEGNPHPKHAWSYLNCLAAEVSLDRELYILNAGTWYRVSSDFVVEVDSEIANLSASNVALPVWGDEHEDAYNARAARQSNGGLALMDRVMVAHAGMASPIEFCDLYSADRRLIHVKRYGQSSILSHLFMQGLVSANSLLADARFRLATNEKLPASHALPAPELRPSPGSFEVAFAIGSTETGSLVLPFFSRVTLKNVARTLTQSLGYRVTLSRIRIDKLADVTSPAFEPLLGPKRK